MMVKKKTESQSIEPTVEGLPNLTVEEVLRQDVIKLDLGGGDHPAQGYVNVDIQYYSEVDLLLDITKLQEHFPPRSVDAIMCRDTLQCFPHSQVRSILRDWYRLLKPRSRLVVQCYDVNKIVEAYQSGEIDFARFKLLTYGRQKDQYTSFHNCFDETSLVSLIERIGFTIQEVVHPEMRIKVVAIRNK
jgi:SAM-dependent methyltransferase